MEHQSQTGAASYPFIECQLAEPVCIEPPKANVDAAVKALLEYWSSFSVDYVNVCWLRPWLLPLGMACELSNKSAVLWAVYRLWQRGYLRAAAADCDYRDFCEKCGGSDVVVWRTISNLPPEKYPVAPTDEFLQLKVNARCWSDWRAGKLNLAATAEPGTSCAARVSATIDSGGIELLSGAMNDLRAAVEATDQRAQQFVKELEAAHAADRRGALLQAYSGRAGTVLDKFARIEPEERVQPACSTKDVRPKKSTIKGEAQAKLIAALTLHQPVRRWRLLESESRRQQ